ncbi:MAG TPA: PKD domain-containing protein, partial [Bacteroidia bacterium]|nr:PKD domain-containing protein [Bacteroidia bacterium]
DCFTIKSTVLGGTGPFTFNWQPGGFTGDSITVCPTTTTTYSLVVTDQWGGIGKATSSIQVTPKPVIQVNNPSMCMGDTAILTASGGTSYSWSTGSTGTSISVSPQTTTTYTVTGKSLEGCMDSTVATVTIKPKPVVQFGPDTASCAPLVVHFINLSTGMVANTTCTWDFGNSTSSQRCEPGSITYTTPGTYSISLTINNGGCSATLTNKSITVYPSPRALFTADPQNSDLYDPTITFLNESTNMNKSILFFGDGTGDSSNVELLKHTYKKEGVYPVCLKVSNATNCVDHYCTEVIIHPGWSFYIPNAFTPGDYSVNPTFNGKGENISDFHLLIFNRWGNLLFESNSLSDGWDGRINRGSEMAQQDVYVYKVSFRDVFNKKHEYIGSVTLLKY